MLSASGTQLQVADVLCPLLSRRGAGWAWQLSSSCRTCLRLQPGMPSSEDTLRSQAAASQDGGPNWMRRSSEAWLICFWLHVMAFPDGHYADGTVQQRTPTCSAG